jgi:c-di-AMP phosphodiesterase-like protein
MSEKLLKRIWVPYAVCTILTLTALAGGLLGFQKQALSVRVTFAVSLLLLAAVLLWSIRSAQRRWIRAFLEDAGNEIEDALKESVLRHPLPMCIAGSDGVLLLVNEKFRVLYPLARELKVSLQDLTHEEASAFYPGEEQRKLRIEARGRLYSVSSAYLNAAAAGRGMILLFTEDSVTEDLKPLFSAEERGFIHVIVDNYEELLSKSPIGRKEAVAELIDQTIRDWAGGIEAAVLRLRRDRYHLVFDKKYYERIAEEQFHLLDEIREIETDADFAASLSMGVGIGGESLGQVEEFAAFALDLALGRGGDQAVVKSAKGVSYYGGTTQFVGFRKKSKSRRMAQALKRLIEQSTHVYIMGHKNPDVDSLGAAIGVYRIASAIGRPASIVISAYSHSLEDIYNETVSTGRYDIITGADALGGIDEDSLLVVVDTHIPTITECPELLKRTERIVLIDHHRKMENYIDNAMLAFMEPNASSTSELITELIQFGSETVKISKMEAELLLAGIFVDTNSFSIKTGTRTFEAAAWLRANGGDSTQVRQILQTDMLDFRQRSAIIANAEFTDSGIAISKDEGKKDNAQVIVAQAADELLDVKGIRASFVVGETNTQVVISARSLGGLNVQMIMERFGGGGHLTMAAAQVTGRTTDEVIELLKEYIDEADAQAAYAQK